MGNLKWCKELAAGKLVYSDYKSFVDGAVWVSQSAKLVYKLFYLYFSLPTKAIERTCHFKNAFSLYVHKSSLVTVHGIVKRIWAINSDKYESDFQLWHSNFV